MLIANYNPFCQHYHTALDSLRVSNSEQEASGNNQELRAIFNANLQLILQEGSDRWRENLPTVRKFVAVMPDISDRDTRDIILFS